MKFRIFVSVMLAAGLSMAGCNKLTDGGKSKSETITLTTFTAEIDDVAKATLAKYDDANMYRLLWNMDDKIAVSDGQRKGKYRIKTLSEDKHIAVFEYESGDNDFTAATMEAFYPDSLFSSTGVPNLLKWPSKQKIGDGSDISDYETGFTLDEKRCLVPMHGDIREEGSLRKVTFFPMGTVLRVTYNNSGSETFTVSDIKVTADKPLSGICAYNPDNKRAEILPSANFTTQGYDLAKSTLDPGAGGIVLDCGTPGIEIPAGESYTFTIAVPAYDDKNSNTKSVTNVKIYFLDKSKGSHVELTAASTRFALQSVATISKTKKPGYIEWIDLGLPSGKLWANMNIGATSETECGDYYFWGETEPWFSYDASYNITWINGHTMPTAYTNMYMKDTNANLVAEYKDRDAAYIATDNIGYMPSKEDWDELKSETTFTAPFNAPDGTKCMKFESTTNGNYILIPYCGRYDTGENNATKIYNYGAYAEYLSSTHSTTSSKAYYSADYVDNRWATNGGYYNYIAAMPIRAIKDPDPVVPAGVEYVDLGVELNGKKILWANKNIGATSPENAGYYIAWGAPHIAYTDFDGSSFTFQSSRPTAYGGWKWGASSAYQNFNINCAPYYDGGHSKYTMYTGTGSGNDGKTTLDLYDDIVARNWGNGWRTPTVAQFAALAAQCVWIADFKAASGSNILYGCYVYKAKNPEHKGYMKNANGNSGTWVIWDGTAFKTTAPYGTDLSDQYNPENDTHIYIPNSVCAQGANIMTSSPYSLYWTADIANNSQAYCLYLINSGVWIGDAANSVKHKYYGGVVRPVLVK